MIARDDLESGSEIVKIKNLGRKFQFVLMLVKESVFLLLFGRVSNHKPAMRCESISCEKARRSDHLRARGHHIIKEDHGVLGFISKPHQWLELIRSSVALRFVSFLARFVPPDACHDRGIIAVTLRQFFCKLHSTKWPFLIERHSAVGNRNY